MVVTTTREELEQRIRDLTCDLESSVSPIGDWKVIKCYEAALKGIEPPYDVDELTKARQAVRDEINRIQNELEGYPNDQNRN